MNKLEKKKIALQNRSRGKRYQKKLEQLTHGKNVGTLGGEDIYDVIFSIEAKTKVRFIGEKFMKQAEANCSKEKIPVVMVHVVGQRHDNDLVTFRYKDIKNILKGDLDIKDLAGFITALKTKCRCKNE